jgi:hypothetical protein
MNCLITQTGKTIDCTAVKHDIICRQQLKITLAKFLSSGGCRVMIRYDTMAIEFYELLTDKQNQVVNKLLKEQPIYCIVCAFRTIEKCRPIRFFVFDSSLLPKRIKK